VVTQLRMLEAFGVSPVSEAVYVAMLEYPSDGVTALAERIGLPEAAVRESLNELAKFSLLRPSSADPALVWPVAPEVGLEALLAHQQAELLQRQHRLEESRAALAVVIAEQASRRPPGSRSDVEEFLGIDAIRDQLEQLTYKTQYEVLAFAPGGAQSAQALEASKPLDEQLLGRAVNLRTVYLDSVRNDPATVSYAHWLTGLGGRVRTVPVLPLRLIIVDRSAAVVPLNPELTSAGITLFRNPGAVAAMHALFEQVWDGALPLGVPQSRDGGQLTRQDAALLRLLAQGDTDEVVARKLGVSVRTVRRIASDLMAQLGARSRFQAGVRAAEHGWLDPGADLSGKDPAGQGLSDQGPRE
jgi:DNA-binding CsgD family transcriptional regulator/sugar-specific transcriptional regulator TrmB